MNVSLVGVALASVLQFIIGAVWYMPLFGKLWGQIHGFDKIPKEEQAKMQQAMWPYLLVQFGITVLTTCVFALLLNGFPREWNIYGLGFFFWLGFIFPTQVSAVIFGGTEGRWIVKKITVSAGAALLCMMAAAFVLSFYR